MARGSLLRTDRPDLAEEWNAARNLPLTLDVVTTASRDRVWWKCHLGHEWEVMVAVRTRPGAPAIGCPDCRRREYLLLNSVQAAAPRHAAEWHPTKNEPLTPGDVSVGEKRPVWWKCAEGHEKFTRVDVRLGNDRGCSRCVHLRGSSSAPLATVMPSLAMQVHPERNDGLTGEDITPGAGLWLWWLCEAGHEWEAAVCDRVQTPGCPYCERRRPSAEFSFATEYPQAALRWHPSLNDKLPSDVLPGSDYDAWWLCDQGHTYQRVVDVERRGHECGKCHRTLKFTNTLGYVYPDIAKEWHPSKNDKSPYEVSRANSYRAWWRCHVGHEWPTSVSNRTVAGTGCPDCFVPSTSQREALIRESLADLFGGMTSEEATGQIPGMGRMKNVDIVIRKKKLVVEYDGSYWHRDRLKADIEKSDALRRLGWVVIRIREEPLPPLTNYDISVPVGFPVAWVAGAVFSKWVEIVSDPDRSPASGSNTPALPLIRLIEPMR